MEQSSDYEGDSDIDKDLYESEKPIINVDDILEEITGPFGLWQWAVVFLLAISKTSTFTFPVFANSVSSSRCRMEPHVEAIAHRLGLTFLQFATRIGPWDIQSTNENHGCLRYRLDWRTGNVTEMLTRDIVNASTRELEPCPMGYVFESNNQHYPGNAIIEFQMLCDRSWLTPLSTLLFLLGIMIGYILGGVCGDCLGRRLTVLSFSALELISGLSTSLSINYVVYILSRALVGLSEGAVLNARNVLMLELTTAKYRSTSMAILSVSHYFFFRALTALLAYIIPNWRWLNLAITTPLLFNVISFFYLPESPRWLISRNRYTEAVRVLQRGFEINHKYSGTKASVDDGTFKVLLQKAAYLENWSLKTTMKDERSICSMFSILFKPFSTLRLAKTTVLSIFILFGIKMTLPGLLFYARLVHSSVYLIAFINSTNAIPAHVLVFLLYRYWSSRKTPLLVLCILTVGILLSVSFYVLYGKPDTDIVLIVCTNIALILVHTTLSLCHVLIPELYITEIRAQAAGLVFGIAGIGSILCDFVNESDRLVWHGFPMLIYAIVNAVTCIAVIIMPDTTGENLSDLEIID